MDMQPIPGYSSYSATKNGEVYSNRQKKGWLKPCVDKSGYLRVWVVGDNGKEKGLYVHQAVALTYLDNPEKKPFVNHLDHNKANNTAENLAWCTHLENIRHDWANGKREAQGFGTDNGNNKYPPSLIKKLRALFATGNYTQMDLSRKFGVPQPTISVIVRRTQWRKLA